MKLTIAVDVAHSRATLVERHSLVAGDTYNPFYVDFSSLSPDQLAGIDTATLTLTLRANSASGEVVAQASSFTEALVTASDGTSVPQPKMRQTTLSLNTPEMRAWFDEAVTSGGDLTVSAYIDVSDAGATYVSGSVPVILRPFDAGGSSPISYTKSETDALLLAMRNALAEQIEAKADRTLALAHASKSSFGQVKIGDRLSVVDGVVSADPVEVDTEFDDESQNPIANATVAESVLGHGNRLQAIEETIGSDDTAGSILARLAALHAVATSGDYNDLVNKPAIPSSDRVGAKWYSGTDVTGTSAQIVVPRPTGLDLFVGDHYLNTSTSNVYRCVAVDTPEEGKDTWAYVTSIRGAAGAAGEDGRDGYDGTIRKTYPSVSALEAGYSTDGLPAGSHVVVDTGNVADPDNARLYRKGSSQYEFVADLSGAPGSKWHDGSGAPTSAVVANGGDYYFDTSTGDVYSTQDGSTWNKIANVRGPKGDTGETGAKGDDGEKGDTGEKGEDGERGAPGTAWISGSAIPDASGRLITTDFRVGDMYLCTANGNAYRCSYVGPEIATFELVMSLKGSAGRAPVWHSGTAVVAGDDKSVTVYVTDADLAARSAEGDVYLNTSTSDLFKCVSVDSATSRTGWKYESTVKSSGSGGYQKKGYFHIESVTDEITLLNHATNVVQIMFPSVDEDSPLPVIHLPEYDPDDHYDFIVEIGIFRDGDDGYERTNFFTLVPSDGYSAWALPPDISTGGCNIESDGIESSELFELHDGDDYTYHFLDLGDLTGGSTTEVSRLLSVSNIREAQYISGPLWNLWMRPEIWNDCGDIWTVVEEFPEFIEYARYGALFYDFENMRLYYKNYDPYDAEYFEGSGIPMLAEIATMDDLGTAGAYIPNDWVEFEDSTSSVLAEDGHVNQVKTNGHGGSIEIPEGIDGIPRDFVVAIDLGTPAEVPSGMVFKITDGTVLITPTGLYAEPETDQIESGGYLRSIDATTAKASGYIRPAGKQVSRLRFLDVGVLDVYGTLCRVMLVCDLDSQGLYDIKSLHDEVIEFAEDTAVWSVNGVYPEMSESGEPGAVVISGDDIPIVEGETVTVSEVLSDLFTELDDRFTAEEYDPQARTEDLRPAASLWLNVLTQDIFVNVADDEAVPVWKRVLFDDRFTTMNRAPTESDLKPVGATWIDTSGHDCYMNLGTSVSPVWKKLTVTEV